MSLLLKLLGGALAASLLAAFVGWLRRRRALRTTDGRAAADGEGAGLQHALAFVLLDQPGALPAVAVRDAVDRYTQAASKAQGMADGIALSITLASGVEVFAMLMEAPVPDGEADEAAKRSLAHFVGDAVLPPHGAHLMVTSTTETSERPFDVLKTFTQVVAGIAEATGAVGVYWGLGGVAHTTPFFLETVREDDVITALWVGVRVVDEDADRVSILGSGMDALGLPDLLLVGPRELMTGDAIAYFFDILSYVAKRGEPLGDGDTLGRTAEEDARVTYVPSPVAPETTVCRVEVAGRVSDTGPPT